MHCTSSWIYPQKTKLIISLCWLNSFGCLPLLWNELESPVMTHKVLHDLSCTCNESLLSWHSSILALLCNPYLTRLPLTFCLFTLVYDLCINKAVIFTNVFITWVKVNKNVPGYCLKLFFSCFSSFNHFFLRFQFKQQLLVGASGDPQIGFMPFLCVPREASLSFLSILSSCDCWGTILHRVLFTSCICFCPGLSFQGCLHIKQPSKINCVSH